MKKPAIIVLCCVVGLAGVVIGAFVALRFGGFMADAAVLARAEADLAVSTRVLEYIQSDKSRNAAELVEAQLDGALVTIDAFVSRGADLMPQTYERLGDVRSIRDSSGYRPSDATVAAAVERALTLSRQSVPRVEQSE